MTQMIYLFTGFLILIFAKKIRTFFLFKKYKEEVSDHLGKIFINCSNWKELLLKEHPRAGSLIARDQFYSGVGTYTASLIILRFTISDIIEKHFSDERKNKIITQLNSKSLNTKDCEDDDFIDQFLEITNVLTEWEKSGLVKKSHCDAVLNEIIDALRGLNYQERRGKSYSRLLDELLIPNSNN